MTGTGRNGPAAAARTSPATPLPPMPSTTMFSMRSRSGSPERPRARTAASKTCSGIDVAAATIPIESSTSLMSRLERRLDAGRVGLRDQALVLGVVDGGRLVDEHHGDVVAHLVLALE